MDKTIIDSVLVTIKPEGSQTSIDKQLSKCNIHSSKACINFLETNITIWKTDDIEKNETKRVLVLTWRIPNGTLGKAILIGQPSLFKFEQTGTNFKSNPCEKHDQMQNTCAT